MTALSAPSRSLRDAALLGYRLSQAHGFDGVGADGHKLGTLERLRYSATPNTPKN